MDYDGNGVHPLTSLQIDHVDTGLVAGWREDRIHDVPQRQTGYRDFSAAWTSGRIRFSGREEQPQRRPGHRTAAKSAFATSRDCSDMEIYVADWNGEGICGALTVKQGGSISRRPGIPKPAIKSRSSPIAMERRSFTS